MNAYEWGVIILAGLSFAGWVIATEVRLRDVQAKLIVSQQKNKDNDIVAQTKSESDASLNANVASELGGSDPTPTTKSVSGPR